MTYSKGQQGTVQMVWGFWVFFLVGWFICIGSGFGFRLEVFFVSLYNSS